MPTVPVLMYHHVNPNKGDMITVTPDVFEAQMRHIRDSGIRTLSLDELLGFIEGRLHLKEKSVAVTFDDGYLDNFLYAFPVMKAYNIKAAVFIVSNWADGASKGPDGEGLTGGFRKNPPTHRESKALIENGLYGRVLMGWEMIKEMHGSGMVDFHSHTMTHRKCDSLSREDLQKELKGSKDELEKRLGVPCDYLCWPKGRFSEAALEIAKDAGYRGVFTTGHGVAGENSDPFNIKRIVVKDGAGWFKTRLSIYTNPKMAGLYTMIRGRR